MIKNIESNNFTFLNIKKDRFLKCFIDNDKYYTDKNNINRLRKSIRKKYYKFLNI